MISKEERIAADKYIADIKAQWKLNAEKDGGVFYNNLQWCECCGYNAMVYRFDKIVGFSTMTHYQCMCCGSYYGPEALETGYFRAEQEEVGSVEE